MEYMYIYEFYTLKILTIISALYACSTREKEIKEWFVINQVKTAISWMRFFEVCDEQGGT